MKVKNVYTKKQHMKPLGFTLLEMLIVVGIIAILMAILLPTVHQVRQSAFKTQAVTELKTVEGAIKAYYAEYARYPLQKMINTNDWMYSTNTLVADNLADLYACLRGLDPTNNPREQIFLDLSDRVHMVNGIFMDPWGQPYLVKCDWNFDKRLLVRKNENKIPKCDGETNLVNVGVAVWTTLYDKKGKFQELNSYF